MMSKAYTAANGQVVTDEMIDTWCESYEHGEFPDGEHTVGGDRARAASTLKRRDGNAIGQDSPRDEGGDSSTGGG